MAGDEGGGNDEEDEGGMYSCTLYRTSISHENEPLKW